MSSPFVKSKPTLRKTSDFRCWWSQMQLRNTTMHPREWDCEPQLIVNSSLWPRWIKNSPAVWRLTKPSKKNKCKTHVKPLDLHGSNWLKRPATEVLHSFGDLYWWNSLQKSWFLMNTWTPLSMDTPLIPENHVLCNICDLPIWWLDVVVMSSSWSSQCFRRVAQTAACSSSWPMQRTIWELQTCKTNSSWLLIQSRSRLPVNFPIIYVASCHLVIFYSLFIGEMSAFWNDTLPLHC